MKGDPAPRVRDVGIDRTVLVTGGAGFTGSHTCVELLEHGADVVVLDDHSTSHPAALDRVEKLAGRPLRARHVGDVSRPGVLDRIFQEHPVEAVVHIADRQTFCATPRSPREFQSVAVPGTVELLRAMVAHRVRDLVFSSSCAVYGDAGSTGEAALTEGSPTAPVSPYARAKLTVEALLREACSRHPDLRVVALRGTNAVGAHESGLLGQEQVDRRFSAMTRLAAVAAGRLREFPVFGDDFDTLDGTAVRDYVHVVDVARAHRTAVERLADRTGFRVYNIGSGIGTSVRELTQVFSAASGRRVPLHVLRRRPGDVDVLVADAGAVEADWGWRPTRDLLRMCTDAWVFQQLNPDGHHD